MSGAAKKWAVGCGIGCLVLLLAGALAVGGCVVLTRRAMQTVEKIDAGLREVVDRHGEIAEFCPPAAGGVPEERIETFLRVREAAEPAREDVERSLDAVAGGTGEEGSSVGLLARIRGGARLIPDVLGFIVRRNEALLESDMGLGEYTYLYVLVYYSWLGNSPADGPPFRLTGDGESGPGGEDDFEVRESRRERILRAVNRWCLPMLRCQLDSARDLDAPAAREWIHALGEEIEAMGHDAYRLPWRDGVPERIEASLRPYRERLAASYSPSCNPLEVGIGED